MKKILFAFALSCMGFISTNAQSIYSSNSYFGSSSSTSISSTNSSVRYQQGYTRKDGTYVNGHMKTRSNNTNHDNFSTIGNSNPYTGSIGSVAKDYSVGAYNYGSGKTIHTGSRGGQYYINSNSNKTYVPKRRTRY